MLTAIEKQRVKNFTKRMDVSTAGAMFSLFEITKPGCDEFANELMTVAHGDNQKVSQPTTGMFAQHGLVNPDGVIPKSVKLAIRKAVALNYLIMHGPKNPILKPDFQGLNCELGSGVSLSQ